MTAIAVVRRPAARRLGALVVAVSMILPVTAPAAAGPATFLDTTPSQNRLDEPIVDVALLPPGGPDGVPRLLTVSTDGAVAGVTRLSVLERDRAWSVIADLDLETGTPAGDGAGTPWLVGLGGGTFAVIASTTRAGPSSVHVVTVDASGRAGIGEIDRMGLDDGIDDAGAADVDGDGTRELVLAAASTDRQGGQCQGSVLWIFDPLGRSQTRRLAIPDLRLASGVVGDWDDVPGEDLLVHAYPNCPAGPDVASEERRLVVRLADGAISDHGPTDRDAPLTSTGAPLRFDADDDGRHEALVVEGSVLAVLDPIAGWHATPVDGGWVLPLMASDRFAGRARIGWLAPNVGQPHVSSALVARGPDGRLEVSALSSVDGDAGDRWQAIVASTLRSTVHGVPPVSWQGISVASDCPILLLPGARLSCDDTELRPGAAWVGTRPIVTIGEGPRSRLLVAAGVSWEPGTLPAAPAPWATAPAGWWRHGPSAPFVLSELRAEDATYYRAFPAPRATMERTTAPDATTAMPGFTGQRMFVGVTAIDAEADEPEHRPSLGAALGGQVDDGGTAWVVRVPVPPGVESGRDGGYTTVPIGDVRASDGSRASRWSVTIASLNDWGELGTPVGGSIMNDAVGPTLSLEAPFSNAVWPFTGRVPGSAESSSTVVVDGVGEMELDRRGRFWIETPLAPWPQTLRVTATDASGNVTVREISVVGGVDYRRFPWGVILAVLLIGAVLVSAFRGPRPGGSRRGLGASVAPAGAQRWADGGFGDDEAAPEMEDLPPGSEAWRR